MSGRLFVLTVEPTQGEQLKLMAVGGFSGAAVVDRFDTQVRRATDSPGQGRITLVVTPDEDGPAWRVVGLAITESAGRGSTFHRRLRVRALRLTVMMEVSPAAVVLTQRLTDFGSSSRSVGRSAAGLVLHSPGMAV